MDSLSNNSLKSLPIETKHNPVIFHSPPFFQKERIKEVARVALKELVAALAIGAIVSLFTTPVGALTLLASGVTMVALNILIRMATSFEKAWIEEAKKVPASVISDQEIRRAEALVECGELLAPMSFSFFALPLDTVIHEAGHSLAALALYKGTPKIFIDPYIGGLTTFSGLSSLGKKLGKELSLVLTAAAGNVTSLFFALTNLTVGFQLRHSYPNLSKILLAIGSLNVLQNITYALMGLWDKSTDFAIMSSHIHPLASLAIIIGLPLTLIGILRFIEVLKEQHQKKLAEMYPIS